MALSNSLSGLIAAGKALDVIGNNIANSQTIGFKSSIARFTNVSAAGKTGGAADSSASSAGVSADNVFQNFEQGRFEITNNPLDMAINGQGFFRLQDPLTGRISYTRDGQFRLSFDENSPPRLVTRSGLALTGNLPDFATDPFGIIDTVPTPVEIVIDPYFPPRVTSEVNVSINDLQRVHAGQGFRCRWRSARPAPLFHDARCRKLMESLLDARLHGEQPDRGVWAVDPELRHHGCDQLRDAAGCAELYHGGRRHDQHRPRFHRDDAVGYPLQPQCPKPGWLR